MARVRTPTSLVQFAVGLFEPLLGGAEHVAEPFELGLDRAEHLPDLPRPLLDREGPEAPSEGC